LEKTSNHRNIKLYNANMEKTVIFFSAETGIALSNNNIKGKAFNIKTDS